MHDSLRPWCGWEGKELLRGLERCSIDETNNSKTLRRRLSHSEPISARARHFFPLKSYRVTIIDGNALGSELEHPRPTTQHVTHCLLPCLPNPTGGRRDCGATFWRQIRGPSCQPSSLPRQITDFLSTPLVRQWTRGLRACLWCKKVRNAKLGQAHLMR